MKKEIIFKNEVCLELGELLDELNYQYEFEFYSSENGTYSRYDLQCEEMEHGYSLNDIISFYTESIENVLEYVRADSEANLLLKEKLLILKKYYKL